MMVTWGRSLPPHLLTAASVRRPPLKHMQMVILFAMSAFHSKAVVIKESKISPNLSEAVL